MARPRQITDDQILDAARQVFLQQGPATSTTVIAEKLGVSQAALFKRFGTKDELLIAAMRPLRQDWIALVEESPDDSDLRQQLVQIARALNAFYEEHVPAMATLRSSGMNLEQIRACHDSAPLVRAQRSMAGWLRQAREQDRIRAGVDADALAVVLLGTLQARAFMNHMAGPQLPLSDPDATIASLVDVLWNGIAPETNP
jgi:AcrR family transcriptional regulator